MGTQCAIAQDAKMAETLAQMNVSKDTIEKLENDVAKQNEDIQLQKEMLTEEQGTSLPFK